MHAWEQIQQTVDYIEENLSEEMPLESLSRMAALSPFYYQRLFKRLVKKPVAEYIKLRRMARATEALLQKEKRILDVALDLGFSSHEQFTRTFKETFGMTPEAYRKTPMVLNRMTKPQLQLNYILVDEDVPLICDGIVLEIGRKRLTNPAYFAGLTQKAPVQLVAGLGIESGVDPLVALWDTLHGCKAGFPGLSAVKEELGVAYPCEDAGYFNYYAGARIDSDKAPEGFQLWELAAGDYIVCRFEAEDFDALVMDALYKAQHYLFDTWLPNHQLTTAPFSIERYASRGQAPAEMELWVLPRALSDLP